MGKIMKFVTEKLEKWEGRLVRTRNLRMEG